MIPGHWLPHVRAEDNELVGYLVPGEGTDTVTPVTLFGYRLGPASPRPEAEARLVEAGLSSLAGRWTLRVPDRAEPVRVEIVEAAPDRLTVRNIDSDDAGFGRLITLDVPVTEAMQRV